MNETFLIALLAVACLLGCSSDQTNVKGPDGPVVFGFTNELKHEMRKLVASDKPEADVEQTVKEFVEELRLAAIDAKIKPTEGGDYPLPPEVLESLNKSKDDFDVMNMAEELMLGLPPWSIPLAEEYAADTISQPRKKLLFIVVFAKAVPLMNAEVR